ncbi:MAG: glycosyltransferase [Nitrososphaerales archaeon]
MEQRAVATSHVVAAVSTHAGRMALDAGASEDQLLVSPNAADPGIIDRAGPPLPGWANEAGETTLGWIGTFGPWHGAQVLIRALALLPQTITALMIGEGAELSMCRQLARDLGVEDRIEFSGTLPHQAAIQRLKACNILVSPHVPLEDEPFFGSPTKLFEYMAIGRPIVASRLEQIAEILRDGTTAQLVDPADERALADSVLQVVARSDKGAGLGRAARRTLESEHTWTRRAERILERVGLEVLGPEGNLATAR